MAGSPNTAAAGNSDPHDLARFINAQDVTIRRATKTTTSYEHALTEIQRGHKRTHWIWYVFPQLAGILPNPSANTKLYAIRSLEEAQAYLAHPVLGPRLRQITEVVRDSPVRSIVAMMGSQVDVDKLWSCMTLFYRATGEPEGKLFKETLDRWFGGEGDEKTDACLEGIEAAELLKKLTCPARNS